MPFGVFNYLIELDSCLDFSRFKKKDVFLSDSKFQFILDLKIAPSHLDFSNICNSSCKHIKFVMSCCLFIDNLAYSLLMAF